MTMLNALKGNYNISRTENGGITHKSTLNGVLDLFAMGAAYRKRTDEDCILLFKKAYDMSPKYALKCLFYIRDVRGGQGERRFFRICMKWLAQHDPVAVKRNMNYFSEYGRWDDLYCLVGTCLEKEAFAILRDQLLLDMTCETPSLCAKWVKSENTSSRESRYLASKTRAALDMDHKHYRKMLSILRARINVLERLMSANKWEEIKFDKIPSKAGLIYKNAFARRDIIKEKYAKFAKDTTTKVNAATLYPYEVVEKAIYNSRHSYNDTDRAMINKYWDNLTDYFNGATFNAIAMVDTSGSMMGTPMNVAISLGLYCAERMKGPFHNHYISFSSRPQLIECQGIDFVDKVKRIYSTNLCENTNIEAAFDMLLNTAIRNHIPQHEMPQNVIVISDMEFDAATGDTMGWFYNERRQRNGSSMNSANAETVMEGVARKWAQHGYECPHIIYWNVNARNDNIPALGVGRISFISGFSPSIFSTIMSGKDGIDLMLDKLDSQRYAPIE